jgi:hypothetical protein
VSDTIKCTCSGCGAKYRLPVEAQGRTARCKRCGKGFQVPRQESLEDTILSWLSAPAEEEEEEVAKPRVISMPNEAQPDDGVLKRARGPIRMKSDTAGAEK